nr:MAG TPA: hypothetical protein [Crassvirales sp.]
MAISLIKILMNQTIQREILILTTKIIRKKNQMIRHILTKTILMMMIYLLKKS